MYREDGGYVSLKEELTRLLRHLEKKINTDQHARENVRTLSDRLPAQVCRLAVQVCRLVAVELNLRN